MRLTTWDHSAVQGMCLLLIFIAMSSARPLSSIYRASPSYIFRRDSHIDKSCTEGDIGRAFTAARSEAAAMASAGVDKLNKLASWLDNKDTQEKTKEITVILNTFQTIFGRVYWGGKGAKVAQSNKNNNLAGLEFIRNVIPLFEKLRNAIPDTPLIDFYCNNDWLLDAKPEKDEGSDVKPEYYSKWDNRQVHNPKRRWITLDSPVAGRPGWCSDDSNLGDKRLQGVLLPSINNGDDMEEKDRLENQVIMLCENWLQRYAKNDWTMAIYKNKNFAPVPVDSSKPDGPKTPKKALDDFRGGLDPKTVQIKDTGSLAFLILHELTHSQTILGNDFTDDRLIAFNKGGRLWSEVKNARASADASKQGEKYGIYVPLKNANSWVFFMTAMYLDTNDWSTGCAR